MRTELKVPGVEARVGYMSVAMAAAWVGVSRKTVKRWIARGLSFYQAAPREKVLVRPVDIDAFLARRQTAQVNLSAMVENVMESLCTASSHLAGEGR
jgi:excisionase family DNA binding protein